MIRFDSLDLNEANISDGGVAERINKRDGGEGSM